MDEHTDSKKRRVSIRHLFFLLAGTIAVLGYYQKQWTLNVGNSSPYGRQVADLPITVHPEVLNLQESFARVAETVKPAVVNIATVHMEQYQATPFEFFFMHPDDLFDQFFNSPHPQQRRAPQDRMQRKIPGTGSGVLIDPEGYILTNEHVVRNANEIKVTLADNPEKKYDGKVIGRDERTDLAVVKIKSAKKLPFAKLGSSDALRVGDWAIAIGSPFGLAQTVTVGVISATRQNLSIENRNYRDLIQTDAAINPGNSGGPLVNIHGEIVGINTAIYTPSGGFAGIGFAIPIDRAKEIIPQLRDKGKVTRSWIGVLLEDDINEATAKVFGVTDGEGALVRGVLPDYPAAKAGLKRGDVIREFAGRKIKNNYELQAVVAATLPGRKVDVKVVRNRKEMALQLTTQEAPASMEDVQSPRAEEAPEEGGQGASAVWLGMTVRELSDPVRERFEIGDDVQGVVVWTVEEGSKAEEIGILHGDIVRAINQESVANVPAFSASVKKVDTRQGVVFDILRRGESRYLSYMGPQK